MKDFQVKLQETFQYDYDGEKANAQFVLVKKPTAKQIGLTSIIRSVFQNNLMEMRSGLDDDAVKDAYENVKAHEAKTSDEVEEDSGLTSDQAVMILYQDTDQVSKVTVAFTELLRSGLFLIDGEQSFTKPLIDAMDGDDFESLMGGFVSNFTYASLKKQA